MVRLILTHRQLDETGRAVGVVVPQRTAGRVSAGEVRHHPAKGGVSQQRQRVGRAVLPVDGGDEVVQHRLVERAGGVNGTGRRAVVSGNVRRTSRVNPVTEATHRVGDATTVFGSAVLRAEKGLLDVTLELLDGLHLRTGDVLRASRRDGLLEVADAEGPAAPVLVVVALLVSLLILS